MHFNDNKFTNMFYNICFLVLSNCFGSFCVKDLIEIDYMWYDSVLSLC